MAERLVFSPEAWARVEIAKSRASDSLRVQLADIRLCELEGLDPELYVQYPLSFAFADYVRDVFCVQLTELLKFPLPRQELLGLLNKACQEIVANAIPMWRSAGGNPDFKDYFVETAYKVIKTSQCHTDFLDQLASEPAHQQRTQPESVADGTSVQPTEQSAADGATPVAAKATTLVSGSRRKRPKNNERNPRYKKIVEALQRIAEAHPRTHQEVFEHLDREHVAVPQRNHLVPPVGGRAASIISLISRTHGCQRSG
jgi:hypothetical protein